MSGQVTSQVCCIWKALLSFCNHYTHTVFQSSSHQAYCNGQVYKHIPKKFTIARRNLSTKLPTSPFCCSVVFNQHFLEAAFFPWETGSSMFEELTVKCLGCECGDGLLLWISQWTIFLAWNRKSRSRPGLIIVILCGRFDLVANHQMISFSHCLLLLVFFLGLPGHATSWCGKSSGWNPKRSCRCCHDPFLEYGVLLSCIYFLTVFKLWECFA